MILFLFIEATKNNWQQIWQILGNQAGAELGCRRAMQPYRSGSGEERFHTLRQEPKHDSTQDVTRSCCRQCRWRIAIDNRPAIRGGDHRVTPFENDNRIGTVGRDTRASQFVAARIKQTFEFTVMRREDTGPGNRLVERRRIIRERRERITCSYEISKLV